MLLGRSPVVKGKRTTGTGHGCNNGSFLGSKYVGTLYSVWTWEGLAAKARVLQRCDLSREVWEVTISGTPR